VLRAIHHSRPFESFGGFDAATMKIIIEQIRLFTMTGSDRILALTNAIKSISLSTTSRAIKA
jgi:hypothetical protein